MQEDKTEAAINNARALKFQWVKFFTMRVGKSEPYICKSGILCIVHKKSTQGQTYFLIEIPDKEKVSQPLTQKQATGYINGTVILKSLQ